MSTADAVEAGLPARDQTPHVLLGQLFELAEVLGGLMTTGLAERGLTRARAEVIVRLHASGPVTQRELADTLRVTPRNVTRLIDALEEDGFVARGPHPRDRRASLLVLTRKGRAIAGALEVDHEAFAAFLFDDLESADLERFAATFEHVLRKLEQFAGVGRSSS